MHITVRGLAAVLISSALGCSGDPSTTPAGSASSSASSAKPGIAVTATQPQASAPPSVDPVYAEMTRGAIDAKHLVVFVPSELGGVKRSNLIEQVFGVAGAYRLADGGYANLDLQNTFLRGTPTSTLDKDRMDRCKQKEEIGGATACVDVGKDRTSIYWFLPDRLRVTLSAPTEATARAMAKDLDIAGVQKLSTASAP